MTSVGGSVDNENWCVYADLDAYCNTAAIMSYGMSEGSAPRPVSPRRWLKGIYSCASNAMNQDKIMMGFSDMDGDGRYTILRRILLRPIEEQALPIMLRNVGWKVYIIIQEITAFYPILFILGLDGYGSLGTTSCM